MSEGGESPDTWCRWLRVDQEQLARALGAGEGGLYDSIQKQQPNLFSGSPVIVQRAQLDQMLALVTAVERAVAVPTVAEFLLARAPDAETAAVDPGARGVFFGYDFHLGPSGPRLIEVNTNAGGAYLNAILGTAQQGCCDEAEAFFASAWPPNRASLEAAFLDMFRSEWRLAGKTHALRNVAIVDENPAEQYLHPELLLFAALFERQGLEARILDPGELHYDGERLRAGDLAIDLVYNRLTDFCLRDSPNAALRRAYVDGAVVVTPHPRAHALFADKRNLALFSDSAALGALGVDSGTIATLTEMVPPTYEIDPSDADDWWAKRKRYFFKPIDGFGSKAAYRGDKLTKRTWASILERPYVAQEIVAPSRQTIQFDGREQPLKLDLRCYVYDGQVMLTAARLYDGQTTNFRTPGGGFAPVFSDSSLA